jgi:hypothetical protein
MTRMTAVVVSHGPTEGLERLLASLRGARCGAPGQLDVVLVDAALPAHGERLGRLCADHDARMLAGPPSAAARRNVGLREARTPFVLFVSADRGAGRAIVDDHVRLWEAAGEELGAVVSPALLDGTAGCAAELVPEPPWLAAGDLSVRRDLLELLGGFDESPAFGPGGDEADVCVRLHRRRRRIGVCPSGAARAAGRTPGFGRGLARAWRMGRVAYRLTRRHPWLARIEPPGFAGSYLALLTVCALAALRWRTPLPLALWAGSAVVCLVLASLARSRGWRPLPAAVRGRLLAASYEMAHLLEGLRWGDPRALGTRVGLPATPVGERLPGAARDWIVLAAAVSLTLLALAALSGSTR